MLSFNLRRFNPLTSEMLKMLVFLFLFLPLTCTPTVGRGFERNFEAVQISFILLQDFSFTALFQHIKDLVSQNSGQTQTAITIFPSMNNFQTVDTFAS